VGRASSGAIELWIRSVVRAVYDLGALISDQRLMFIGSQSCTVR